MVSECSRWLSTAVVVVSILHAASSADKERCEAEDKIALLGIKSWFNNDTLFATWLPYTDCCKEWDLVTCDPATNRIITIDVSNSSTVAGTIPPGVAQLTSLQILSFRYLPNLHGPIPPAVAALHHLIFVRLDNNALTGPIPGFLGQMGRLFFLSLANNSFSGPIPSELALAPALTYIDLSRNLLSGPIPDSFGYFNRSGYSLTISLSSNRLSGPIPISLGRMDFLEIDLSNNRLTGDASFLFTRNKTAITLDISRNRLSFDFSKVKLRAGITSMELSHNRVFGGLPSTGWENVYYLNVSYNRMCGPIPHVGQLTTFDQSAYFHNRCLCGPPLSPCKSPATTTH